MTLINHSAHLYHISDGCEFLGKVDCTEPGLDLVELSSFWLYYKLVVVYFVYSYLRLTSQINHERVLVRAESTFYSHPSATTRLFHFRAICQNILLLVEIYRGMALGQACLLYIHGDILVELRISRAEKFTVWRSVHIEKLALKDPISALKQIMFANIRYLFVLRQTVRRQTHVIPHGYFSVDGLVSE